MNGLLRLFCCLCLVSAATVHAKEACDMKTAEAIWASTHVRLHALFGKTVQAPSIAFFQDIRELPNTDAVATFGYYDKRNKALHIVCKGKGAEWFDIAIRHEATHYYLDQVFGQLPLWLNEGLATYMEAGDPDDGGANPNINGKRLKEFIEMLKWGKVPPLSDLLRLDPYSRNASQYYAAYWALVYALMHDQDKLIQKQRRQLLKELLTAAQHNPASISQQLLGGLEKENLDLADWELRWHREIWDLR